MLEPLEQFSVWFSDYAHRCAPQLGRLGINTGERYKLVKPQIFSLVSKLLDDKCAVQIRPYLSGYVVMIDDGELKIPFKYKQD
jgi:hypothetical protein